MSPMKFLMKTRPTLPQVTSQLERLFPLHSLESIRSMGLALAPRLVQRWVRCTPDPRQRAQSKMGDMH